jgi:hypothetical protein
MALKAMGYGELAELNGLRKAKNVDSTDTTGQERCLAEIENALNKAPSKTHIGKDEYVRSMTRWAID